MFTSELLKRSDQEIDCSLNQSSRKLIKSWNLLSPVGFWYFVILWLLVFSKYMLMVFVVRCDRQLKLNWLIGLANSWKSVCYHGQQFLHFNYSCFKSLWLTAIKFCHFSAWNCLVLYFLGKFKHFELIVGGCWWSKPYLSLWLHPILLFSATVLFFFSYLTQTVVEDYTFCFCGWRPAFLLHLGLTNPYTKQNRHLRVNVWEEQRTYSLLEMPPTSFEFIL